MKCFTQHFNASLKVTVVATPKYGDGDSCSSYRSVSLTSILLKTRKGHLQQDIHQVDNGGATWVLAERSCLINLISFLDELTDRIGGGGRVEVSYLDFQKFFESVNHSRFGQRVKAFGADAEVKNWIAQSLKGMSFRVRVKRCLSDRITTLRRAEVVCLRAITRPDTCRRYSQWVGKSVSRLLTK